MLADKASAFRLLSLCKGLEHPHPYTKSGGVPRVRPQLVLEQRLFLQSSPFPIEDVCRRCRLAL